MRARGGVSEERRGGVSERDARGGGDEDDGGTDDEIITRSMTRSGRMIGNGERVKD